MKIEINVSGIDWKELAKALAGTASGTVKEETTTKKKVGRKAKSKTEGKVEITDVKGTTVAEDFLNIPLDEEAPTQTTAEIVEAFSKGVAETIKAGKLTEKAVREAVRDTHNEGSFKHLGNVRLQEMQPADAKKFIARVKQIIG